MLKHKIEAFSRTIAKFGTDMQRTSKDLDGAAKEVDAGTDLRIFIDGHVSQKDFPTKAAFVPFEVSETAANASRT